MNFIPRPFARLSYLFVAVFVLFANAASADVSRGTVQEGLTVESKILGHPVRYSVYLPADYATSNRSYPVVYLLHGIGDNDTAWIQYAQVNLTADEAIAAQEIAPMIIVMPDAGRNWYVNNFDGSERYEDFFFQEFIPAIESMYRIRAEKSFRGIAGLSMGGSGALLYSFKHPDIFAACAAFSVGLFTDEEVVAMPEVGWNSWNNFFGPVFGPDLKGEARLSETWRNNNILSLAKTLDVGALSSVRYYTDCGDDDFLFKGNAELHVILRERNVPHEARVRNGGHQWSYWRNGLKDGLAFISESFRKD